MPDPTVEEVRGFLAYIESERATPEGVGFFLDRSRIAALCRSYLAAHEPQAKPELTAGEFAGLVIGIIRGEQTMNHEQASQSLPGARDWYNGVHSGLEVAAKEIQRFASEHNIKIEEPRI